VVLEKIVMAGLVQAIYVFRADMFFSRDARDKPGQDDEQC
jgi:hypothetical protein